MHLKQEQLNVIMQFLRVRDVFAVLSTGLGKLDTFFTCLPLVFDELTCKMDPSIVLVVSPLKEKTCWMPLCIKS